MNKYWIAIGGLVLLLAVGAGAFFVGNHHGEVTAHSQRPPGTRLQGRPVIEIGVAIEKATPEQLWIRDLVARLPFGKVLVAIANKHARQLWAMLAREEDYDAHAWLKHPMVQRPRSTRPFQTA